MSPAQAVNRNCNPDKIQHKRSMRKMRPSLICKSNTSQKIQAKINIRMRMHDLMSKQPESKQNSCRTSPANNLIDKDDYHLS